MRRDRLWSPSMSPSERHVPREPAGCAKPIITASERELREIRRCCTNIDSG